MRILVATACALALCGCSRRAHQSVTPQESVSQRTTDLVLPGEIVSSTDRVAAGTTLEAMLRERGVAKADVQQTILAAKRRFAAPLRIRNRRRPYAACCPGAFGRRPARGEHRADRENARRRRRARPDRSRRLVVVRRDGRGRRIERA